MLQLILYSANLLNSLVSSKSFLWHSQGFLYVVSCHLQIVTVLLLPFQFYLFIFFFVIAVVRTSNTMLNKSGEVGHLCLLLDLCLLPERKCFQLFTTEYDISYGLVIYGLSYVELYSHCFVEWFLS